MYSHGVDSAPHSLHVSVIAFPVLVEAQFRLP
jgi:hypothetical protein